MTPFNVLPGSVRMLNSTHGELVRWAAELWPSVQVPPSMVDVLVEPAGTGWRVEINRDGLRGLSLESAEVTRAEEVKFFLFAFERRAVVLESLVRALISRAPGFFASGLLPAPVPHTLIAEDLLQMGHGAEAENPLRAAETLVQRLAANKVLRTPHGETALALLIARPR